MLQRLSDRFDVVLVALDRIESALAHDVVTSAGIPAMRQGPDFFTDGELGMSHHALVRSTDLLVPAGARPAARQALVEAWGEESVARLEPPR